MFLYTAGWGLLPLMMSKAKDDVLFSKGRFGDYNEEISQHGRPRVWFHAASVGEVGGAIPIMHNLHNRLQHATIFLTVSTPQGFHFARTQLPDWARVLAFPLDFTQTLKRAFDQLRPDIYVALESEFWPNLYHFLERHRVPAVLLNGRLSKQSAKIYGLLRPLFQPIFGQFQWLAMHSEEDLRNVLSLGAKPERTMVLGSSKYEGLLTRTQPEKPEKWRKTLQLPAGTPVIVGGSLRRSECIELLEVYRRLKEIEPQLAAIFAPRHMEQLPNMTHWLESRGIPFQFLSRLENSLEKRYAPIVLVDRIGVLFELYALGDLIFCGGTLAPIGGHNILEPAAWKKPVFYGPYLQKVDYEHRILLGFEGSFVVQNSDDLFRTWSYWIKNLPELQEHGTNAMLALEKLGGVTAKQVELIVSTLLEKTNMHR